MPTDKKPDYINISLDFQIHNSPHLTFIKNMVSALPTNQMQEIKSLINKELSDREFINDLNKLRKESEED